MSDKHAEGNKSTETDESRRRETVWGGGGLPV